MQPNPLLRTVRDSFPSYSSSPSKGSTAGGSRPEGTRGFTIIIDCQHDRSLRVHHPEDRDVICSPLLTDSFYFLVMRHLPIISLLTEPRISHSVSPALHRGIRFPKASQPRPPTACLTVSLPRGRRTWGSKFRTIDLNEQLR